MHLRHDVRWVFAVPAALALVLSACNKPKTDISGEDASSASSAAAPRPATSSDEIPEVAMPPSNPAHPAQADIPAPEDVAAPPADAQKTASGLASKVLQKGAGKAHPKSSDVVKVHYTGWTKAGKMFDSSVLRGEPTKFPLDGVIPGWTEGVQLMVQGEKRRFWIPAKLAYGEKPPGGAPAGDLTFDIELLEITVPAKPPAVPEDVKAPPTSAKKTEDGLAYRLLSSGKADAPKPKATDVVKVNYTGWTTDGKMFDSSIPSGEPAMFPLNRVIKGWTEGVQLMKVGDKMRFWIPGNLAYGDKPTRPGAPAGTLVFDIELLGVGGP